MISNFGNVYLGKWLHKPVAIKSVKGNFAELLKEYRVLYVHTWKQNKKREINSSFSFLGITESIHCCNVRIMEKV